ncbi:MAG TPA: hypothetical protein VGP50_08000 [Stellaceae bacterium]|nr:hypothetical protein [Stellaceae bacterium]
MMAARYARQRLDGHAVVNRQTGARIGLDWERGLKNATAPGMPPALLLAVPAIPAMLAQARYLRALVPRPPYPPHVLRYRAFAARAEIGGRRVDAILIVQEDRQHRMYLDRVLGGEGPPRRDAGGANPDAPSSTMGPADDAAGADWMAVAPRAPSIGALPFGAGDWAEPIPLSPVDWPRGEESPTNDLVDRFMRRPTPEEAEKFLQPLSMASPRVGPGLSSDAAPQPASTAIGPSATDNGDPPPVASSAQDKAPPSPLAPIPLSDIQKPIQFRGADYEAMGQRLRYLNGKYDPQSWGDQITSAFTGGLNDPSRVMTDSERAEQAALKDKLNQVIKDHYDPQPTPDEARLDNMASSPLGTAAWLGARALGASQQQQDATLGTVGALENIGTAAVGPRTPVEPVLNVPAVAAARAAVATPETLSRTAPPQDGEGMASSQPITSLQAPAAGAQDPERDTLASSELRSSSGGGSGGRSRLYDRLDDFKDFRHDGAYADDPLSQNNAARDYVIQRQQDIGAEHFIALDTRANDATHAVTSLRQYGTAMPEDLEDAMRDPNAQFNLHHSHSQNTALSDSDVSQLGLPGARWVVAHASAGDISAARLTPEAKAALGSAEKAGQDRARDLLGDLWNKAYDVADSPIQKAVDRGEFTEAEGARIKTEIANRALADSGVTEYVTTHSLPSHPLVDEMQQLANTQMRQDVGQQIPELANVHSPQTRQLGIGEAMARISRGDADAAAGRPGRATGGRSGTGRAGRPRRQEDPRRDQRAAGRPDSGKYEVYPREPGEGAGGEAREEVAPRIARASGREFEMPPTSYGHLIILAARYARLRLDGHAVVNRETRVPIALTWERGLKEIVAPGTPPEMLLAVPAIPAMLAGARYLGSAPDPLHRPDIANVHGFASAVEVGGRRIDVLMVVRENRQGRLFLDRVERRAAAGARAA